MLAEQSLRWGAGAFQLRLDGAYKEFKSYCKTQKLSHSQPPFLVRHAPFPHGSPKFLHDCSQIFPKFWKCHMIRTGQVKQKNGEELLLAKAWNGRIILAWLTSVIQEMVAAPHFDRELDDGRWVLACAALTFGSSL